MVSNNIYFNNKYNVIWVFMGWSNNKIFHKWQRRPSPQQGSGKRKQLWFIDPSNLFIRIWILSKWSDSHDPFREGVKSSPAIFCTLYHTTSLYSSRLLTYWKSKEGRWHILNKRFFFTYGCRPSIREITLEISTMFLNISLNEKVFKHSIETYQNQSMLIMCLQ